MALGKLLRGEDGPQEAERIIRTMAKYGEEKRHFVALAKTSDSK
jgi:hypothetical protein